MHPELNRTGIQSSESKWKTRGKLSAREYGGKLTGKKRKLWIGLAPRDGIEIVKKDS
jgi:hypothetical protein